MSVATRPQPVSSAGRNNALPDRAYRRPASILIVDDEPGIRNFLQRALTKQYGLVEVADGTETAEEIRRRCRFDLLIVDIRLQGRSGLEWISGLRDHDDSTDVIFITAYADLNNTIAALRFGAADFILKPFRIEQMLVSIENCLERRQLTRENTVLRRQVGEYADPIYGMSGMIGDSQVIQNVCKTIKRVAATPSSVLIGGETGTGKELAARALHHLSSRKGPFVPVNCVAISSDLFESELFGHTKGAFTSAHQTREGLFGFANGGTLFLDEISEMSVSMQAKLLRVLESRTIRPVGSEREVPVDVRVVAASNRDLEHEVKNKRFREDLFYRLNVVALHMPALREHPEDIPLLFDSLSQMLAQELGINPIRITEQELLELQKYKWPGNVRELRNLVERSLLLGRLAIDSLANEFVQIEIEQKQNRPNLFPPSSLTLKEVEKCHLIQVLESTDGNKSEAARRLGISRKTLERKLCFYATKTQAMTSSN